jgi:hypothetical protein
MTNSKYEIAATLYSLEAWFVSGICVNTLHKGDDDNDDDDDDDNDDDDDDDDNDDDKPFRTMLLVLVIIKIHSEGSEYY